MAASYPLSPAGSPKRVDLHCHSRASTEADEALLEAIRCPESYSEPEDVYAQAKRRAMSFVTITDHDSIAGVTELQHLDDVIIGEELTCWFPEDQCKMHVLVWGIDRTGHEALQKLSSDIYQVADYIARHQIAHAVAHPLYRQNGKLDRWHLERLLVIFKGFECLNGAHSMLHREAFEPMLGELDEKSFRRLQQRHGLQTEWPQPWVKSRTGGSDDHGLFNIGRTWTEFPADVSTVQQVLESLRTGRCAPGGQAGSSLKLAHNFFGVGMRYYSREVARSSTSSVNKALAERLVGDRGAPAATELAVAGIKQAGGRLLSRAAELFRMGAGARGTALFGELFMASAQQHLAGHTTIRDAFRDGKPPLAEHEAMFAFISDIVRDVSGGIAQSVRESIGAGEIGGVIDAVASILAQQGLLLPYYFALFHQNQERHLLSRITGHGRRIDRQTLRVGVFTDSADTMSPSTRLTAHLARIAEARQLRLVVHTCSNQPAESTPNYRNFKPLMAEPIGGLGAQVWVPPVLEMLEWADRQQFDVILAGTCGPTGLCGLLAASMLRVPLISIYQHDLHAHVFGHTHGDYRVSAVASRYAEWFHRQSDVVLARSRAGAKRIDEMRATPQRASVVVPPLVDRPSLQGIDRELCWEKHHVREPVRVVCPAGLESRRDIQLLADTFERIWQARRGVALVLLGSGPWLSTVRQMLRGLPFYCIHSTAEEAELILRSADVLLYPSASDVTAQVVIDAQHHGVPVIARAATAAGECVEHELTGLVVSSEDPADWAAAAEQLLSDEPRRQRMARNGPQRTRRFSPSAVFDTIWQCCLDASLAARLSAERDGSASDMQRAAEQLTEAMQI